MAFFEFINLPSLYQTEPSTESARKPVEKVHCPAVQQLPHQLWRRPILECRHHQHTQQCPCLWARVVAYIATNLPAPQTQIWLQPADRVRPVQPHPHQLSSFHTPQFWTPFIWQRRRLQLPPPLHLLHQQEVHHLSRRRLCLSTPVLWWFLELSILINLCILLICCLIIIQHTYYHLLQFILAHRLPPPTASGVPFSPATCKHCTLVVMEPFWVLISNFSSSSISSTTIGSSTSRSSTLWRRWKVTVQHRLDPPPEQHHLRQPKPVVLTWTRVAVCTDLFRQNRRVFLLYNTIKQQLLVVILNFH